MNKSKRRPDGVLLDLDGTLLDSNDAHAKAYVDALTEAHVDVPFERVRRLIGMGADKLLPAVGVEPHSGVGSRVQKRKQEIFDERYLPTLRPTRGARDLLLAMKKRGLTLAIATSAEADELAKSLAQAKVGDLIDAQSTSSDAGASKPDPDIVEAAIDRTKLDRRYLVMVGDTPYDIEAALRAGVPIIALRSGGWTDAALHQASEIYDDPADLLASYDQSLLCAPVAPAR